MSTRVNIPPDLEQFVDDVIASGRCESRDEVVAAALSVFQELDRRRAELRREIQIGINSGASVPGDEVFERLEQRAAEIAAQHP